ncbi:hypothetical protein BJX76DRAFT_368970, partial [Aspergillus varians]
MPKQSQQSQTCSHPILSYTNSPHAAQVKYQQPTQERLTATKPKPSSRLPIPPTRSDIQNFPAPLVLPGDDLAVEPDPPQDYQKWLGVRNQITSRRRTIYVASPTIPEEMSISVWTEPSIKMEAGKHQVPKPQIGLVIDYITAFYHGLPVKELQFPRGGFTPWADDRSKIGLNTQKQCVMIRARPSPDGVYPYQLNLTDLLDAAVAMLPSDAYALCLLVDHDLFEDEDDVFVCGRAFGGRRVAVVSTARYNPLLDTLQGVEQDHVWPASHCQDFLESICRADGRYNKNTTHSQAYDRDPEPGPLEAAVSAFTTTIDSASIISHLPILWLARVLRTTSHELGHCFGIGHCVYYACLMQGSASLSEDTRQPPYLCPVDLAKLLSNTQTTVVERYAALLDYCERPEFADSPHFRAYAAWLRISIGGGVIS